MTGVRFRWLQEFHQESLSVGHKRRFIVDDGMSSKMVDPFARSGMYCGLGASEGTNRKS